MELTRQQDLVPPEVGEVHIDVVGLGATGSAFITMAPRVGIMSYRLWDNDKVEAVNIPLTSFEPAHVGMPKVEAAREIISRINPDATVETMSQRYTRSDAGLLGREDGTDVLVAAVDNMAGREALLGAALTKMGEGRDLLYLDPRMLGFHYEVWVAATTVDARLIPMFSDEEGTDGPCTERGTVGTSYLLAGQLVGSIISHVKGMTGALAPRHVVGDSLLLRQTTQTLAEASPPEEPRARPSGHENIGNIDRTIDVPFECARCGRDNVARIDGGRSRLSYCVECNWYTECDECGEASVSWNPDGVWSCESCDYVMYEPEGEEELF